MTFIIQSTPYRVFSIISQATGCMLQHGSRSVSSGHIFYLPGELPAWAATCLVSYLPGCYLPVVLPAYQTKPDPIKQS